MRMVVFGVATAGVAAAIACVQPVGQSCHTDLDCGFHDYCEFGLGGQCVRWEDRDPSCLPPCGVGLYCSKKQCHPRYSSIEITSPAAGSIVPGRFDVAYALQEFPDASDSTPTPYSIDAFDETTPPFEYRLGELQLLGSNVALQGQGTLSVSLDASVTLVFQLGGYPRSPPVQLFVDQTRDH